MRELNNIKKSLVALACLAALLSCSKSLQSGKGGGPINFSGGTQTETKATYSGTTTEEDNKELIHWTVGDGIRIYCAQATHPNSTELPNAADYKVTEVLSDSTQANIGLDTDKNINGLHWNDDATMEHVFYGVYPSPAANGICTRISGKTLDGTLPQSQNTLTGALTYSNGDCVLAPDLKWQMMQAGPETYKASTFPATGTVFLTFTPLTTAIQFTLRNDNAEAIKIKEVGLVSDSTQIAGSFTISDVTEKTEGFPTVTGSGSSSLTDDENTVKLVLASPDVVSLENGKKFTFTFFIAPVSDVNDLTFHMLLYGESTPKKLKLEYQDHTGLTFPRCKKSSVYTKFVGASPMDAELVLTLADWQTLLSKDGDEYFDVTFGTKSTE